MSSDRAEKILEITTQIVELDRRRAALMTQFESLIAANSVDPTPPHRVDFLPLPPNSLAIGQLSPVDVRMGPSGRVPGVARFGFSKKVFEFMQQNPDREFSPEEVAKQLGQPERKGLVSTALSRLRSHNFVQRTQVGRYVYTSTPPIDFEQESL